MDKKNLKNSETRGAIETTTRHALTVTASDNHGRSDFEVNQFNLDIKCISPKPAQRAVCLRSAEQHLQLVSKHMRSENRAALLISPPHPLRFVPRTKNSSLRTAHGEIEINYNESRLSSRVEA